MKAPASKLGLFITFEGTEGCGKSTQIRKLSTRLRHLGYRVLSTREPGGTPVGESIRHLLKFSKSSSKMLSETELLLFAASRAQLVREMILPALRQGKIVLCDRFVDSTTVYQGIARKLNMRFIAALNAFATAGRHPDLTLVFDVNARLGLERAKRKTKTADRMETQANSFYEAVRRGFLRLAKQDPTRVKVVNASASLEETSTTVWNLVLPRLSLKHSQRKR